MRSLRDAEGISILEIEDRCATQQPEWMNPKVDTQRELAPGRVPLILPPYERTRTQSQKCFLSTTVAHSQGWLRIALNC